MNSTLPFQFHPATERGHTRLGWLDSRHSFSFGNYIDQDRMNFRSLRVINDDWVEPGAGFGKHPHRDMEIISIVLEGALAHEDSTGTVSELTYGDVQVMHAGSGIMHSEFNGSKENRVHFLQIWIEPAARSVEPGYQEATFDRASKTGGWLTVVGPKGSDAPLQIHQDALLRTTILDGSRIELTVPEGRYGYVHVATGAAQVEGKTLGAGDAISLVGPATLRFESDGEAELIAFELG